MPAADFTSNDSSQTGKTIVAPNVGTTAKLCMFPAYPPPPAPSVYYSITGKNVGTATACNVAMDGTDQNDWSANFYYRCMNADADRDGWNDSLEHTMGVLTYYAPYASTIGSMGSNYLRPAGTSTPNDQREDTCAGQVDGRLTESSLSQAVTSAVGVQRVRDGCSIGLAMKLATVGGAGVAPAGRGFIDRLQVARGVTRSYPKHMPHQGRMWA